MVHRDSFDSDHGASRGVGHSDGLSNLSSSVFSVEIKRATCCMLSMVTSAPAVSKALPNGEDTNFINGSMRQFPQDDDLEGKAGRMIVVGSTAR